MKKRILALLLALCTVVSSASVFSLPGTAAEGESGAASPGERSQFP